MTADRVQQLRDELAEITAAADRTLVPTVGEEPTWPAASSLLTGLSSRAPMTPEALTEANPGFECFAHWGGSIVCEMDKPPKELCLASLNCGTIAFTFRQGTLIASRMKLSPDEWISQFEALRSRLGEPSYSTRSIVGLCSTVETATFQEEGGKTQFEEFVCSPTVTAAYGPSLAVIVSLST